MLDISTPKELYDGSTLPVPDKMTHSATELNDRIQELQNSVEDSGQTLDAADPGQLSKTMFANGVAAQSMLDTGGVNTVVLTPVTGASGLRLATPTTPDYTLLNGAIFTFKANNTNTGNMSVNIGQTAGTLIGALSLYLQDGATEVPVGNIISGNYYSVMYTSAGGGAFIVISETVGKVYESAWFAVSAGDTNVLTHNLGSILMFAQVMFAPDDTGSPDLTEVMITSIYTDQGVDTGASIQDITTTQLTIQSGDTSVATTYSPAGGVVAAPSGWYKVIARLLA